MSRRNSSVLRMTQMALLIALVVALQMVSALIPPVAGMVSITLTLIPVVVGGILLGKKSGAVLGFAFGLIVLINCINALDPGGNILWSSNPFYTATICIVKGIAAGFFPAWLYEIMTAMEEEASSRKTAATIVAALSAPVINTGLFVCGMLIFFRETLYVWAGGTEIVTYILLGLAGVNFLVEFGINIILSPAIIRTVDVIGKKFKK